MSQTVTGALSTIKKQRTGQLCSADFRPKRNVFRRSYFSPQHND